MIKWDKALGAGPGHACACVLPTICVVSLGCITFGDIMIDRKIVFLLSEVKPAGLSVSLVQRQSLQRDARLGSVRLFSQQQLLPALLRNSG